MKGVARADPIAQATSRSRKEAKDFRVAVAALSGKAYPRNKSFLVLFLK
jgi:hypothetical protein